ncbi:MAG: FAD-dependent oxidoreductase [Rhodospirillales bacterium]|jgi:dimethylglycine dehydrogenase|nr:FAD-dependent oxidoreductase [Rhodospirillales bacterium]
MKTTARVVVIGGGITGCSILYHLAKMGWTDSILIERQELTSGSSWHAAGGLFTVLGPNPAAQMHKYTFDMYQELEKQGYNCGFHFSGGLNLFRTEEEKESFTVVQSAVRRLGIESEFISLKEAKEKAPIINTDHLIGAMWEVEGGHVDPASATNAFAQAARDLGATVERFNPVIETNQLPNGHWQVVTEKGTIECEKLVNAAGLWGREVAALAGITLPLVPVEHHYLVTENIPQIEELDFELPEINDNEVNVYSRQEGMGMLVGAYEDKCYHWSPNSTPLDFGHELLPNDLDRMLWNFEQFIDVVPCVGEVGVKRVINGPMIFSPDLAPLLGPHPDKTNYFCANGVMKGFNEGAGIGMLLAEWMAEGEPPMDIAIWDVARFGNWASKNYMMERTAYYYEHRSHRAYPYQEIEAGRPLKVTSVHDRLEQSNAVFGQAYGCEHPLWFAPEGVEPKDNLTYRRPNWFEHVNNECRVMRSSVSLMEYSAMSKLEVSGPGAEGWLNHMLTNKAPTHAGKTVLSQMLSKQGRVIGDFTVNRFSEDTFLLLSADFMQLPYLRHFKDYLPADGVTVRNLSNDLAGLHICGPHAQELLGKLANGDVSTSALPFMNNAVMDIGNTPGVSVVRVSYTGEAGYELYCPQVYQRALYDQLMAEGKPLEIGQSGTRALMWSRLEKSFPAWELELSPDYTIFESGVSMFTNFNKGDFVGREAVLAQKDEPLREVRTTFTIDADGADTWGDEAIFRDGEWVGYVTSGGYGSTVEQSIALGYIKPEALDEGAEYAVEILGNMRPAQLHLSPLYDPKGEKMRA